jgi:hypothetical protein
MFHLPGESENALNVCREKSLTFGQKKVHKEGGVRVFGKEGQDSLLFIQTEDPFISEDEAGSAALQMQDGSPGIKEAVLRVIQGPVIMKEFLKTERDFQGGRLVGLDPDAAAGEELLLRQNILQTVLQGKGLFRVIIQGRTESVQQDLLLPHKG